MLTDVKPLQYENAQSPMAVTLYTFPPLVTVDGITTEPEILELLCCATFTETLLITVYFKSPTVNVCAVSMLASNTPQQIDTNLLIFIF